MLSNTSLPSSPPWPLLPCVSFTEEEIEVPETEMAICDPSANVCPQASPHALLPVVSL